MLVQSQRALEYVLHVRLFPDMVLTDSLQLVGVPAIHPAIADVGQRETPTA